MRLRIVFPIIALALLFTFCKKKYSGHMRRGPVVDFLRAERNKTVLYLFNQRGHKPSDIAFIMSMSKQLVSHIIKKRNIKK